MKISTNASRILALTVFLFCHHGHSEVKKFVSGILLSPLPGLKADTNQIYVYSNVSMGSMASLLLDRDIRVLSFPIPCT